MGFRMKSLEIEKKMWDGLNLLSWSKCYSKTIISVSLSVTLLVVILRIGRPYYIF